MATLDFTTKPLVLDSIFDTHIQHRTQYSPTQNTHAAQTLAQSTNLTIKPSISFTTPNNYHSALFTRHKLANSHICSTLHHIFDLTIFNHCHNCLYFSVLALAYSIIIKTFTIQCAPSFFSSHPHK